MTDNTTDIMNSSDEVVLAQEQDTTEKESFLTFLSDGLTFAVSTNDVTEIITNHAITFLPMVPDYVKGIINLRGQIIPIVDIRLRLGKPSIEETRTTCIIVLEVDSISIGIIVDAVSQVCDIDRSKVSSVPVNNQQDMVNGMISLDEKTVVLLLDCQQLAGEQIAI